MIRKYQTIWSGILLIFILLLSWLISKGEVQIEANNDIDTNNPIYTDEDTNINEEELDITTVMLGTDVRVNNYIEKGNLFYAVGSKNNYPFIQLITKSNNEFFKNQSTTFNKLQGSVTNLVEKGYYLSADIKDNSSKVIKQDFFISRNEIIPFYKKQLTFNYSVGTVIYPKYIVIHETANTNVGADAAGHYNYWSTYDTANASTHFVVDSTQVYQMLELNQMAWHVGDNKGHSDILNNNSIGIEIAVNSDGDFTKARQNAIELAAKLLKSLNMDISRLKNHNDASGKYCPANMLNDSTWNDFKYQVEQKLKQL